MLSPLQLRRQRIALITKEEKELVNAQDDSGVPAVIHSPANKNEWDLVRASIRKDQAALKTTKQLADKITYKTRCLLQYEPYILRENIPLDVAVVLAIWLLDCGNLQRAIPLGLYCVKFGAVMPSGHKRDVATFMADAILGWSESQWKQGHSTSPYFEDMFNLVTTEWKMFDQVEAKYYKQAGLMALSTYGIQVKHISEPEPLYIAKALLEKAHEKWKSVGVSTRIDTINKRLMKLNLPLTAEE